MKGFLSYKKSGVDYSLLDPVKRMAQMAGFDTIKNLEGSSFKEVSISRGEAAYLIETSDSYYAFVEEGLGTKNLVADETRKMTGRTYYDVIAQDTVAMMVNDLITVGAKPLAIVAYWAVGDSKWFSDTERSKDLVDGWKRACDIAGVVWGGGETPTLKDVIYPSTIDLAGAAFGIVKPKGRVVLGDKLKAGDVIIFLESSGIHANGLTLARKLANRLPKGFAARLESGRKYGEELLTPTIIYSRLVNEMLDAEVDIHYMVNITGHGWRKLMRARKPFTYVIDKIPPIPEIFKFIQENADLSAREMYATFNMGAGFALFVKPKFADQVTKIAKKHKIKAWVGGGVKTGSKRVIINPLNITYKQHDLIIR